jgi:hypothetical protein
MAAAVRHLPYRGRFGDPRPASLSALALPPAPMPGRVGLRPLKAWRYIGVFGPELMICVAAVRVGRARQSFWAVWDRQAGRLHERTSLGAGEVRLTPGSAHVAGRGITVSLTLEENAGVETVCPSGAAYGWTRKQGGVRAHGTVDLPDGRRRRVDAGAVIDDTSAYYERHTSWRWCAGVGTSRDGRELAWNLVQGVNDPPAGSERTVWSDGKPVEVGPVRFAADLSGVDALAFAVEATREHSENLLLLRSRYRQPFGTFSGTLPGGSEIESGYGVMEDHDVWW